MSNLVRLGQRLDFLKEAKQHCEKNPYCKEEFQRLSLRIKTIEQEIEEECRKASESNLISFIRGFKKSA